jgi:hypothetical protein
MTEAEWLVCTEPGQMVDFLSEKKASRRKFRLFSCACCRYIWPLLTHENSRKAVQIAERFADDLVTQEECDAVWDTLDASFGRIPAGVEPERSAALAALSTVFSDVRKNHGNAEGAGYVTLHVPMAVAYASRGSPNSKEWRSAEAGAKRALCDLLRDVFANPWDTVKIKRDWLRWNDGTVSRIAQSIYEECTFDRLPILADALEDAGCHDADILDHCRQPGPHVRGCWVVDLLLGKE